MIKKVAYFTAIAICLFIINDLAHSIYDLWQKQNVMTQTTKQLEAAQAQNKLLKQELAQAQTTSFIEQEAVNKLFLIKPGEQEVVIPTDLLPKQKQIQIRRSVPNWQQWIQLFFHD